MALAAPGGVSGPDTPDRDDPDFDELRALIIGPERARLQALQARLDDPVTHARDVGAVLPQALHLRALDPELTRALAPPVEQAISASVRRNPRPWADALFPLMGPAIRKAVAASLASMVESLNRTLEHSLSWRALKWRVTALRTGRPFAEVVLLNTLRYRVEQVFLIERESGLLLQHAHAASVAVQDADMVSGMLTAIREFVRDSFRVSASESLEAFQVGNLFVWVEQGPRAMLAAVVRGAAPQDYRRTLQHALETIHLDCADALAAFDGDASAFEVARPALEDCLQAEYHEEPRSRRRWAWVVAAIVLLALAVWTGIWLRTRMQWARYLDALRAQPGLVVVSSGRSGGQFVVTGLRDPLAADPAALLARSGLSPGQVAGRWTPYQALEPELVLGRARGLLQPPEGVSFALRDGVLRVEGTAPARWLADTYRRAPFVPGVQRVEADRAFESAVGDLAGRIAGTPLYFVKGTPRLTGGQASSLRTLTVLLRELDELATAAGRRLPVTAVGNADADGPELANVPLSQARADAVVAMISTPPPLSLEVAALGVGSREPAAGGRSEPDLQRNRRVVVRVGRD